MHFENLPESGSIDVEGKRDSKKVHPSDYWQFYIAMTIPYSENEDCHEDRGPNPLGRGPGRNTMEGAGLGASSP